MMVLNFQNSISKLKSNSSFINYKYFLISIYITCLSFPLLLSAQSPGYIHAKVINSATSEPIPFASVELKNNQLGVFANAEGEFRLIMNPAFRTDSLLITCIGFKRTTISVHDLSNGKENKILLMPAAYVLGGVDVIASKIKLSSITIIQRAIYKIKRNYPKKPFNYIAYYRDYQKKDKSYINLNEAIVQTFDNGFSNKSVTNKYRLLDFKKNMDFTRMNVSPYYDIIDSTDFENFDKNIPKASLGDQYGNEFFILMTHDAIRNNKTRSFSFIDIFSQNFIPNHEFSEPTTVFNNNLLLYKINFTAKNLTEGDSLQVSGAIYIQPKDYSIHKLEYSSAYLLNENKTKPMFNINIEYGYENSVDSLMCLKYISFNNYFKVYDMDDSTYFRVIRFERQSNFDSKRSAIVLTFNHLIDPATAIDKDKYQIEIVDLKTEIDTIIVKGNRLIIRLMSDDINRFKSIAKFNVPNIQDTDGNILNKRRVIEFNQYRELFVQEYNKSLPDDGNCYLQYLPLDQNCVSNYPGKEKYWMNTPENININK